MAFASMGSQLVEPPGHGPYCFRIHGQLYHRTGHLYAAQGETPVYGQLYIIEGDQAVQHRLEHIENVHCSPEVMHTLQQVLSECSPYAAAYVNMHQTEQFEQENAH